MARLRKGVTTKQVLDVLAKFFKIHLSPKIKKEILKNFDMGRDPDGISWNSLTKKTEKNRKRFIRGGTYRRGFAKKKASPTNIAPSSPINVVSGNARKSIKVGIVDGDFGVYSIENDKYIDIIDSMRDFLNLPVKFMPGGKEFSVFVLKLREELEKYMIF